ncbi:hypothetical protein [Alkalicoccus daliensis]|uniref:Uncharacterized protein n=1 Tax=Alkalicoccus daliensis TaxID=745820 RepID=A0A1H0F5W4_9BACI|nr:hypothetical protein [Alkalicoccus daliensis]SDN89971.1 hypothetical protein SAMN04488053_104200 [Alkalicoccus daliensis]
MGQYAIKNITNEMWVSEIVSSTEIVQTNKGDDALLFQNEKQAAELCKKLSRERGCTYQVVTSDARQIS